MHEHYPEKPAYHFAMYLIPLAWIYVTLMMAIAEATSSQGTLLGAVITFVLYGMVPVCVLIYLMGTPLRRKQRKKIEAKELQELRQKMARDRQDSSGPPDAGSHAAGAADVSTTGGGIAAVGKEP